MLVHGEKLSGLHPRLSRFATWAAQQLENEGSGDLLVVEGFRSAADQDADYAKGRTALHDAQGKPQPIITNARGGESPHNFRLAVDLAPMKGGTILWSDTRAFDRIGALVWQFQDANPGAPLKWGGDFHGLVDRPHVELDGWRNFIGWDDEAEAEAEEELPWDPSRGEILFALALSSAVFIGAAVLLGR